MAPCHHQTGLQSIGTFDVPAVRSVRSVWYRLPSLDGRLDHWRPSEVQQFQFWLLLIGRPWTARLDNGNFYLSILVVDRVWPSLDCKARHWEISIFNVGLRLCLAVLGLQGSTLGNLYFRFWVIAIEWPSSDCKARPVASEPVCVLGLHASSYEQISFSICLAILNWYFSSTFAGRQEVARVECKLGFDVYCWFLWNLDIGRAARTMTSTVPQMPLTRENRNLLRPSRQ